MKPQRCAWDPAHLALASKLSLDAWHYSTSTSLPQFLQQRSIRNLFLTNHFMLLNDMQQGQADHILLQSPSVGTHWGTLDMLLDMSMVSQKNTKVQYLQAAAAFPGTVYLIGVMLSQEEALEWWDALYHSRTPPHSLFFLYRFLDPSTPLNNKGGHAALAAQSLLDMIAHSKRIKEVTVFFSDLVFDSSAVIPPDFALDSLHLEKVSLSNEFLEALSSSKSIKKRLTLSSHTGSTWHPWFNRFLQWQLQELSLLGYNLEISDLIDFLADLQKCNDTSLHSLSLGDAANDHAYEMSTALVIAGTSHREKSLDIVVAAVVDALHGSGLPFFSFQGLELSDPAIEAQLLRNQQKHSLVLKRYKKVPTMALRLFICGDAYAGKTTLLLSLDAACSKRRRALHKLEGFKLRSGMREPLKRTRGIEVYEIVRDNIRMSMWDMAGQREFHAFHDYMFPDSSSNHSSPAMFMFVWSPVISKSEEDGEHKFIDAFEDNFCYWLKFIASKTHQSNVTHKVIVVITRKDQMDLVADALKPSIYALKAKFSKIDVVDVLEVDARSTSSVKPVAASIFETAKQVLHGHETYEVCKKLGKCLSSWFPRGNAFKNQPIIKWEIFEKLCKEKFRIENSSVQRAIASSLNESGHLIYLNNMLVLDPNWFCHEVMGNLIHFPESPSERIILPRGYVNLQYLESILQYRVPTKVRACDLVELMESMHLCCKVPNDPEGKVFIAATLSTRDAVHEPLQWRGGNKKDAQEFAYLGRRLECDRKESTFLTPGLFPMLQVLFNKAFGEIEADVKLQTDVMSICIRGMEIIVESGIAKGEHVIDVMVRAPDLADMGNTLMYVEDKIIRTIIRICAQPVGNQGVKLVQGVIRPDCVYEPAPLEVREDQCVLIRDLKLKLRRQIEAGEQQNKLLYQWKESRHLKPVASPFVDLLGTKEFETVLLSYKASLKFAGKEVNQMINLSRIHENGENISHEDLRSSCVPVVHQVRGDADASSSTEAGCGIQLHPTLEMGETSCNQFEEESRFPLQSSDQIQDDLNEAQIADENGQQVVLHFSKTMVSSINHELQNINTKLDRLTNFHEGIHEKLSAMQQDIYQIRSDILPKVLNIVKKSLYFAKGKEVGKVPRLVFFTTEKVGKRRKMVTAIFKDLMSVQIELLCEHRGHPHRVEGQKGICLTIIDEGTLKKALPWLIGLLKILTLVARLGAHVVAGLDNIFNAVPDLASIIALGLDTPGFLDNHGLREAALSSEALTGWQQWLVSVLEKHGGMRESNIYEKFKLRRAIYQDTLHVAWLCPEHYPVLDPPASTAMTASTSLSVIPFPLIT